jgi:dihydroorotate dehydrogenase electron transfer subunit
MSNITPSPTYADHAVQREIRLLHNERIAERTYRLRFHSPEIARATAPGQFIMLRLSGRDDPLLARAFAVYDLNIDEGTVDIVYIVVGKMTGILAESGPGTRLSAWGPLGNGFPAFTREHVFLVCGGVGITPMLLTAKAARRAGAAITLCYGARSENAFVPVEPFEVLGVEVRFATEDGRRGRRGLVTDLLGDALAEAAGKPVIAACGPDPMLAAVAALARNRDVPCYVSLENVMSCGIGICFGCVCKTRDASGKTDYRRTCVEGPVFDAREVVWEEG